MGKGDWRRPCQVPKEQFDENFEAIFGKKPLNIMSDEDRAALKWEEETGQPAEDMPDEARMAAGLAVPFFRTLDVIDKILEEANDRSGEAGGDIPDDGHDGGDLPPKG